jgi:hypothetical protein
MSSKLFVSKYQLYLPNKEELRALLNKQLEYLSLKRLEDKKRPVEPKKKNTKKGASKFVRQCITNLSN